MELTKKEVRFDEYCKKCVHENVVETEDPCNRCLTNTVNEYSHKPVEFKEKK